MNYFHIVDEHRIKKEIEKADMKYLINLRKYGTEYMEDQDRKELEAI